MESASQTSEELTWSFWHAALYELKGAEAPAPDNFEGQLDIAELAKFITDNELDNHEQLRSAADPGEWLGAKKFNDVNLGWIRKYLHAHCQMMRPKGRLMI